MTRPWAPIAATCAGVVMLGWLSWQSLGSAEANDRQDRKIDELVRTNDAQATVIDDQIDQGADIPTPEQIAEDVGGAPPSPLGSQGERGEAGAVGPPGPTGPQGPRGEPGPQGVAGRTPTETEILALALEACGGSCIGQQGAQGPAGPAGAAGADGSDGASGPAGADGSDGADGADGQPGPQGDPGAAGVAGAQGDPGAVGPEGPAGTQGETGSAGPQGAPGADGATPTAMSCTPTNPLDLGAPWNCTVTATDEGDP